MCWFVFVELRREGKASVAAENARTGTFCKTHLLDRDDQRWRWYARGSGRPKRFM
jgi:hypothetical protein